ncbi:MAG: DUF1722 domain-containing protein [Deltaproteobacteria bacterium]|nr:DUF1722 domain-containing protein [Deltaproteobacteria bacterium]
MTTPGPSAARPRLLVSRCLDLEACRYDGTVVEAPFVRMLAEHAELVPVCPEVAIGLGVPRDPIRIVVAEDAGPGEGGGARRLVQPSTGRDLTAEMERFAAGFAVSAGAIDGAILKGRSPSCGNGDVKLFRSAIDEEPSALGRGLFAGGLAARRPGVPIVDEVAFEDRGAREGFLTRVFSLARLRAARATGTRAALTRFHAEHKLLLLALSERVLRELGPLAAGRAGEALAFTWDAYAVRFVEALDAQPSAAGRANALMHALGYFRGRAEAAARHELAERLARQHRDEQALEACASELRAWIVRHGEPYLGSQAFFWPYPEALR